MFCRATFPCLHARCFSSLSLCVRSKALEERFDRGRTNYARVTAFSPLPIENTTKKGEIKIGTIS